MSALVWLLAGLGGGASFDVLSAVAVSSRIVDVTFSAPPQDNFALTAPGFYAIDKGLTVLGVQKTSATTVRLYTTTQFNIVYKLTVNSGLVHDDEPAGILDLTGNTLNNKVVTFTGIAAADKYLVSDIDSRSICTGQAIRLTWENPSTAQNNKIVRRPRAWPFDLTDVHDVVYDGVPITEFVDTGITTPITSLASSAATGATSITTASSSGYVVGDTLRIEKLTGPVVYELVTISSFGGGGVINLSSALTNSFSAGDRVAKAKTLLPQTYYYYTVLVSALPVPSTYDIDDDSRTFALSVATMDSKSWLQDETPHVYLERDAKPLTERGGGGFLDKWYSVMGCWLNLLRGYTNAISLLNDADNAPFHVLTALNQSLGIDPEGYAYDFDIVRRPLTSLIYVYQRKGTCPGVIETVRMFTKWEAECIEFGSGGCRSGASNLKTWDGSSLCNYGQGSYSTTNTSGATNFPLFLLFSTTGTTQIYQYVASSDGSGVFVDSTAAYADHLWKDGTLRGWIGDVACVDDNIGGMITTKAPPLTTSTSLDVTAGDLVIPVNSTASLQPGMTVQITKVTGSAPFPAEIVQISSISAGIPGSFEIQGPGLLNSYPAGSMVSIGKSIVRAEYLGSSSSVAIGFSLLDPRARWVENQWIGRKLLDNSNNLHTVVSNTTNQVFLSGLAPPSGTYSIAYDFTLGASYALRTPIMYYKICNGVHSTTFEPTFDIYERGTIYDPYNRLYNGPGLVLSGAFGPSDVGVLIKGNVPITLGKAQSGSSGSNFILDPEQPPPAPNALVGYFLNPNQNQEQFFEIVANTSATLTVAGDITSFVVSSQYYYVLSSRDKARFQRITTRLQKEFTDTDVNVHVLFQ